MLFLFTFFLLICQIFHIIHRIMYYIWKSAACVCVRVFLNIFPILDAQTYRDTHMAHMYWLKSWV
jgi:hypothetical protein